LIGAPADRPNANIVISEHQCNRFDY